MALPEQELTELFVSAFSDEELRQFLAGWQLGRDLPGQGATQAALAFAAAELLMRHKLIDAAFFAALIAKRPQRSAEIRQVQQRFLPVQAPAPDVLWANGRYRLMERLGEGGFAEVWKATDNVTAEFVALKILLAHHADHERPRQRFLRGASVLAKLRHPALVAVRQADAREGPWLYQVLDYVHGADLTQLAGTAPLPVLLHAIVQVGDALAHVHDHEHVHRDVKPGNILLTRDGQAKLIDFDLVAGSNFAALTRTAPIASLPFAAPEILDHATDVTPAADVYGLAMTTAFILRRGQMPMSTALRDLDGLLAQVPEALRGALRAALHLDPRQRTASTREFTAALRAASPNQGQTARPLLVWMSEAAVATPPVAPVPTFDDDGALQLWNMLSGERPADLGSASIRVWPATQVAAAMANPRRRAGEFDALAHDFDELVNVATVLALGGHRPAWLGLTRNDTPVLVLSGGHIVLHDRGLPPAEDLAFARGRAREPGVPVAIVGALQASEPRAPDITELAQEIRRGAHHETDLRRLARFSRARGPYTFQLHGSLPGVQHSAPILTALVDQLQASELVMLSGAPGSGRSHSLQLLAEHLAGQALVKQGFPVVLVSARGWRPPFRLLEVLRDAGYTAAAAAALRLAVMTGQCIMLLDDVEAPATPIAASALVDMVLHELQTWRGPTSRIVFAASAACPWSVHPTLEIAVPNGTRTQVLAQVIDDPEPRMRLREATLRAGTVSLLGLPRLARPLLDAIGTRHDATPLALAADLQDYIQTWTERAALHVPGTTAEQFQRGLEALAVAIWTAAPGVHGDAITRTEIAATLQLISDAHGQAMTRRIVDGALLGPHRLRPSTVVQWLASERLARMPVEPFPRHHPKTKPEAGAVYFVHSSLLELLFATHLTRRLGADAFDLLAGPRLSPNICALCSTLPTWAQARDAILRLLCAAYRVGISANALMLAIGDATLESSRDQPWQLARADLRGADLRRARLRGANLAGADLRDADLRGADLEGADLAGADLSRADLRGANLDGTIARGASLRGARLDGVHWRDADLREAVFSGSEAMDPPQDFTGARLDAVHLDATLWRTPIGLISPASTDRYATWLSSTAPDTPGINEILGPPHLAWARDVAWSPDSGSLVTIHSTGFVCIWNARPLRPLHRWQALGFGANRLALSARGHLLATWTEGRSLFLWDMRSGEDVTPTALATLQIRTAAWAHRADRLALSASDGSLWLWDVAAADLRKLADAAAGGRFVRFLADDTRLLTWATHNSQIDMWDVDSGAHAGAHSFTTPQGTIIGLAVAPDGERIALQQLGQVTLLGTASGFALQSEVTFTDALSTHPTIEWSPDGSLVVVAVERFGPILWDTRAARWTHHLAGGADHWQCLRFSPDSAHVVAIREGTGSLVMWETLTGREVASHVPDQAWVTHVALAAERRSFLAALDTRVLECSLPDMVLGELGDVVGERLVALMPDTRGMLVVRDQTLVLVDLRGTVRRQIDRCMRTDGHAWSDGHFTSDGQHFVCRISDDPRHEVAAWDLATGRKIFARQDSHDQEQHFQAHTISAILGAGISGGRSGQRGCLEIWQPGAAPRRLEIPDQLCIYKLDVNVSGTLLAAGGSDNVITLWDLHRWASGPEGSDSMLEQLRLGTFATDGRLVDVLRFAPQGHVLAAASGDSVYLIDAATRVLLRRLGGHGFRIASLAFDTSGEFLIVGDWSNQVRLWNVRTGALIVTLHTAGACTMVTRAGRYRCHGTSLPPGRWYAAIGRACVPLEIFDPAPPGPLVAEIAAALAT